MRSPFTKRLTAAERAIGALLWPERTTLPRTRGECSNGVRPCPHVSCRHNLSLDISPQGALIRHRLPGGPTREASEPNAVQEIWDRSTSNCALDVAERGGMTFEEMGEIFGRTRQRMEQEVKSAMESYRMAIEDAGSADALKEEIGLTCSKNEAA